MVIFGVSKNKPHYSKVGACVLILFDFILQPKGNHVLNFYSGFKTATKGFSDKYFLAAA